jgi:C4-dicarboxylate transporter DctQ subunit
MCVLITAINIAQITGRYLFFYSIPWSEQLSVVIFILIIFFGQNLATRSDNEIRIDVIPVTNASVYRIMLIVSDLACLVTLVLLFASSILLVQNAMRFSQVISSLHLPYLYVFCVIPLGFFLIFASRFGVLARRISRAPDPQKIPGEEENR